VKALTGIYGQFTGLARFAVRSGVLPERVIL